MCVDNVETRRRGWLTRLFACHDLLVLPCDPQNIKVDLELVPIENGIKCTKTELFTWCVDPDGRDRSGGRGGVAMPWREAVCDQSSAIGGATALRLFQLLAVV